MKILAVDDKKLALEALIDAISTAAPTADVYGFRSPEEALHFSLENPCDVAFLDIDMQGMTGIALAKKLKLLFPKINVIFATGYHKFAEDALALHCSGYLMKPITPEKVRQELADLRHPLYHKKAKRVRFQTFGNFEVYIDGQPVKFRYEKAKELLAYLVDRGTFCTNHEIMAALWEKDPSSSYFRTLRKELVDVFKEAGCEDVLVQQRGKLGIVPDLVECDCYDWKKGKPRGLNAYHGEYMAQYSWGEFTLGALNSDLV